MELRRVAQAMALLWTYRTRSAIHPLVGLLGFKRDDGAAFTQDDVKQAVRHLRDIGWREDMPGHDGFYRLAERVRSELYRELLDEIPPPARREALHRLDSFRPELLVHYWPLQDTSATVALIRLELLAGTPGKDLDRWRQMIARSHEWNHGIHDARRT